MTREEAHKYMEDLQRLMTQYRGLFSENLIEATGQAILALEQPEIVHRKRQRVIKPKHNNVSDETKEMIDQLWRAQK